VNVVHSYACNFFDTKHSQITSKSVEEGTGSHIHLVFVCLEPFKVASIALLDGLMNLDS